MTSSKVDTPRPPPAEEGRERCFASIASAELQEQGIGGIVTHFQRICCSPAFLSSLAKAGFEGPLFYRNDKLSPKNGSYYKFHDALQKGLLPNANLGLVFHGTPTAENILSIQTEGLDPRRRRGQAFGPGEYFSKEPQLAVTYCRNTALEILVFVVVLPDESWFTSGEESSRRRRRKTDDVVVVNNNQHQIPIGTIKFKSMNRHIVRMSAIASRRANLLRWQQSWMTSEQFYAEKRRQAQEAALTPEERILRRRKSEQLHQQQAELVVLRCKFDRVSKIVKSSEIKSEIIQRIITSKVDIATEVYQKHQLQLDETAKREISWFAHNTVDSDVVSFYFPDLPSPFTEKEATSIAASTTTEAKRLEACALLELRDMEKIVASSTAAFVKDHGEIQVTAYDGRRRLAAAMVGGYPALPYVVQPTEIVEEANPLPRPLASRPKRQESSTKESTSINLGEQVAVSRKIPQERDPPKEESPKKRPRIS